MLFLSYLAIVLPALAMAKPMKPFRLDQRGIRDMRGLKQLRNGTFVHKRACTPKPSSTPTSTPTSTSTTPTSTPTTPTSSANENHQLPAEGIRGVNVGSWFLIEPYMMEGEWQEMGGELCGNCMECANTEFDLVKKLGQEQADQVFAKHWETFITKDDVDLMVKYNLNSVRIPIGFWIIEETVNRDNEYYPKGGLDHLRKACKWFNDAGITVLLDLHAAPGGSTRTNSFAGRCVDPPQFWGNEDNVSRHLKASAELTRLIHSEPENFGSVWGLEALNEPPQNGDETPGYMDFMTGFVKAVRDVETELNVSKDNAISTVFMDISWQWQNNAGNPAFAANGGSAYDAHTYYNWGGAGGPLGDSGNDINTHIWFTCQGDGGKIESDKQQFNTPSFRGEWWLLGKDTGILSNDDKENIKRFGDAQKMGYSPEGGKGGFGYYFWSWKMTNGDDGGWNHMRSYKDAVAQGYMHEDAAQYFYPDVCK
ncbi:glycoside hydrolase [Exidia glandulosa HHB12029]|uniref:glucan endo-1,6-beta-glucosidase n=1 Tax=Exidia glandulosa HHB12029 TaxID=1314781 RepID=A0A165KKZ0_EXIGL|nr:glycoside hydrolase [Exidia glandulosa HHB12029]